MADGSGPEEAAPEGRKPRVYVAHEPPLQLVDLRARLDLLRPWGDVVFVASAGSHPAMDSFTVSEAASATLDAFDADVDYITWLAGDPATLLMIGNALGLRGIRTCRFLRISTRTGTTKFIPVNMALAPPAPNWDRPPVRAVLARS